MRHTLPAVAAAVLLLSGIAMPAGEPTVADQGLSKLAERSFTGDRFNFAVIGDTRHWVPIVQPQAFVDQIATMNLLRPHFCIDIGDLILGYTDDEALLTKEWDAFIATIGQCDFPFIPVVGNHDVISPLMERLYTGRIGPMYFSFDYGNAHFVCMSSETVGAVGRVDEAQLAWLRDDLAAHGDAAHVFVFMHQPMWAYANGNWQPVHELLKQYNTGAVFAGHWHHYEYEQRDGIPYFITGGGGAEIGTVPEAGDFHHFCEVAVDGADVRVAVIPMGAIAAPGIVTPAKRQAILDLPNRVTVPAIPLSLDGSASETFSVQVANPGDQPIGGTISWTRVPQGMSVEPLRAPYAVAARGAASVEFHATVAMGTPQSATASYEITYPVGTDGTAMPVRGELRLLPNYQAHRLTPTVDGDPSDWQGVAPLVLDRRDQVRSSDEVTWTGPEDQSVDARVAWDAGNLYMLFVVTDDVARQTKRDADTWQEDSVQVGFDPKNDTVRPKPDNDDYEYLFSLTPDGPHVWCEFAAVGGKTGLIDDVKLAVRDDGNRHTYEIAFPWQRLAPAKPIEGATIGFTFLVNDSDAAGQRDWMEWTPGIGATKDPSAYGDLRLLP